MNKIIAKLKLIEELHKLNNLWGTTYKFKNYMYKIRLASDRDGRINLIKNKETADKIINVCGHYIDHFVSLRSLNLFSNPNLDSNLYDYIENINFTEINRNPNIMQFEIIYTNKNHIILNLFNIETHKRVEAITLNMNKIII